MQITLNIDEVIEAVRAHVSSTLPQLNFDDADITMHADCVEIDLSSVAPAAEKKTVKATVRKAKVKEAEPAATVEIVSEITADVSNAPFDTTDATTISVADAGEEEPVVPTGLADTSKPAKSLFA